MRLINLTPHPVTIGGHSIAMSDAVVRCDVEETPRDSITVDGVDIRVREYSHGQVTGLPDPQEGVGYVVSLAVAKALPQRRDLFIPDERVDRTNPAAGFVGLGQVPLDPDAMPTGGAEASIVEWHDEAGAFGRIRYSSYGNHGSFLFGVDGWEVRLTPTQMMGLVNALWPYATGAAEAGKDWEQVLPNILDDERGVMRVHWLNGQVNISTSGDTNLDRENVAAIIRLVMPALMACVERHIP